MADIPVFDTSNFTVGEEFLKKVEKPWGYELIFTPPNMPFTGKILHINAGKRLSLQIHDKKEECYYLFNGRCSLVLENNTGELEKIELKPGIGYKVLVGQRHRHWAITDCDVFEVSTPEIGTTYRLEDDYKRPDETEQMRKEERK
ncbi:cupin [Candidatus Roizmanbacteria bacterium]|nr:cupin [Candidatus Roizmanbacteria bacterium]